MKQFFRKTLAMVFTLVLLLTCIPLGGIPVLTAAAADAALPGYKTGDIIEFGSYPQSKVTDSATLSKLDAAAKNWKSYNYYSGTGEWDDGQMTASTYMKYCDIKLGGAKYRAVTFSEYRPFRTGYTSSASNTFQDDNGYYVDNVYYFQYEPLRWRVLDAGEGLVMSEYAVDSQAYQNYVLYANSEYWGDSGKTHYASDWANSSLRHWLNNDFYNTAFSSAQQSKIQTTHLENKSTSDSTYDGVDTDDNIFLLSYWDAINSAYGFSTSDITYDVNRRVHSTDYAKCQGCYTYTDSNYQTADGEDISWWWLRSPFYSHSADYVYFIGYVDSYYSFVNFSNYGVVPALRLTQSSNPESPVPGVTLSNVASSGKIKVSWNSTGAAQYQVYRATSKSGTYKLMKTTTGTSYVNTSAVAGKTYYYKVCGVNADGTKSAFSAVKYRTCDLPRPEITLSNVASSGKVKLTWAAIDGAVKYRVYRATSENGTYKLMKTTTSLSYINTSVTAGTKYYYKVKAIAENSAANSAYSTVKARTAKLARPTISVSRSTSSGNPTVRWNRVDGAISYKVYRATSANGDYTLLKTTANLSFTNTSAVKGTTYYYKVKALCSNSAGNSAYSAVKSIRA